MILSCGAPSNRGELIGVKQKKWFGENPTAWCLSEGGLHNG